jgi:hypothetical protein
MNEKQQKVISNLLGDDFLSDINKSELSGILKLNANTVTNPEEIKLSLQIVPRAILSWLMHNLIPLKDGAIFEQDLRFVSPNISGEYPKIHINKISNDNYNGQIIKEGKILSKFLYRSLPGVGLIIMSTLELYSVDQLDEIRPKDYKSPEANSLQNMIDERLKLNSLIESVVDRKLAMRDAIKSMIRHKINQIIQEDTKPTENPIESPKVEIKKESITQVPIMKHTSKLKDFLEKRKARLNKISIPELGKNEIQCIDCGATLYNGNDSIKLCVCYGEHVGNDIKIVKNENGVKLQFPSNFDADNIEMIFESLKRK